MVADRREHFLSKFTEEKYARFLAELDRRCGVPVSFRCAETPVFFERETVALLEKYAQELTAQIVNNAEYLSRAAESIPKAFRVPEISPSPLFVQADFGFDEDSAPKLVEIQGFPSLYAFQPTLGECYRDCFDLGDEPTLFLNGLTENRYFEQLRSAIVGDCDPAETFLLELYPERQKTRPDFVLTEKKIGVRTVCATQVRQEGKTLVAPDGTPIRRIYSRLIADDVERAGVTLPFDLRADLKVTWAGHPAWYFLLSKLSLPLFKHACVPETHLLSDLVAVPGDLDDWVLKPLFSFAGQGVTVGPSAAQVAAVTDPEGWLLQRRVRFAPTVRTPEGPTKAEVRVLCLSTPGGLRGMTTLVRLGRGALMGVDQNRDQRWIGASAGFIG